MVSEDSHVPRLRSHPIGSEHAVPHEWSGGHGTIATAEESNCINHSTLCNIPCCFPRLTIQMGTISLIPQPDRLYVIGDIHGRADLLECMIDQLHSDLEK